MKPVRLVAALAALLLAPCSFADTHYVAITSTNPVSPYVTWETAATNIQDAIDVALSNDTVLVSNGVYATGGRVVHGAMTNRVAITNAITVQGLNGPNVTIIRGAWHLQTTNGDEAVRCAYLGANAVLSGFTLSNGATRVAGDDVSQRSGGGAWCDAKATIINCVLVRNAAMYAGGGSYDGTLRDCTLVRSTAFYGGGSAGSTLSNCMLIGNAASGQGGGTYWGIANNCIFSNNECAYGGGSHYTTLRNCRLTGNLAYAGGACDGGTVVNCSIYSNHATLGGGVNGGTLFNCTLVANTATQAGGGSYGGARNNCIIYYNEAPIGANSEGTAMAYSCTLPHPGGTGNITNDPLFVTANDLHVQPASPCLNAGNNGFVQSGADLEGNARVTGGTVDIGAYEFVPHEGKAIIVAGNLLFGEVATGRTVTSTVRVGNYGDTLLTITNIACPPGFGSAWTGVLSLLQYSNIVIAFSPTSLGQYSGLIDVMSDATAGSNTLNCSGIGIEAQRLVGVSGDLDFGEIVLGKSAQGTMTITNTGNDTLRITSVAYPAGFEGAWMGLIEPNTASNVTVTFTPAAAQFYGGVISVHSDATVGTNTLECSGFGIEPITHFVDVNSASAIRPYTNWLNAASNIQDAIDACAFGDIVLVSNGVYASGGSLVPGVSGTNRIAVTNGITVRSVNGPTVTTIKGQGPLGNAAVRCAYLGNGAVLAGFTLRNGFTTSNQKGGGIFAEGVAATVSNCVIAGNVAGGTGPGGAGGGSYRATLYNSTLVGNSVSGFLATGAGASESVLYNCALIGNTLPSSANVGGGGAAYSVLHNCTVMGNYVAGGSLSRAGGVYNSTSYNSIVFYNTPSNHAGGILVNACTTPMPTNGTGNITNAPMTWSTNNGHLMPGSPCVDAGDSSFVVTGTDLDGDARTNGAAVDIGCDEFCPSNALSVEVVAISGTNAQVNVNLTFEAVVAGNPLGFVWSFGDGPAVTGPVAVISHAYATGGLYRVAVVVTNLSGSVAATTTVQVAPFRLAWVSTNSTAWDYSATNWLVLGNQTREAVFASSNHVVFDDATPGVQTNIVIGPSQLLPGSVTVDCSSNDYSIAGTIGGIGGLLKAGTGRLTLLGTNTFRGAVTIEGGALALASGKTCTLYRLSVVNVQTGATFDAGGLYQELAGLNGGGAVTSSGDRILLNISNNAPSVFSGTLAGGVGLAKQGGTLVLSGTNTFTGNVSISNGPVVIKNSDALGIGPKMVHLENGTAGQPSLTLDGSEGGIVLASNISFTTSWVGGTLTNLAGTNVINGNFEMTWGGGDTTIIAAGGHLTIAGNMRFIQPFRNLKLGGPGTGTVSGQISSRFYCSSAPCSDMGVRKIGAGTWTLSAVNVFPGPVWIDEGTLQVGDGGLSNFAVTDNGRLVFLHDGTGVLVNALSGTGLVVQAGSGTVVMHGLHTFSGHMQVSNGTLVACGSFSNSDISICSGGTLGGTGFIGVVTNEGGVAPGFSVGVLRVSNYVQSSSGTLDVEIGGPDTGIQHDQLAVSDLAFLDGGLEARFVGFYAPTGGERFVVVQAAGGVLGSFAATNLPLLAPGGGWEVAYTSTSVVLAVTGSLPGATGYALYVQQIPDPTQRGFAHDPEGDGFANLLEYVTSGSATNSDGLAAMAGDLRSGLFALLFHRNTNADDVTLIVEGSDAATNEAAWTGIATNAIGSWGGATHVTESGTGTPVAVTVQDTAPHSGTTNRFLRLRVTRP